MGLAAAAIGNKVFFAGGLIKSGNGNSQISDRIDIYDLSNNTWSVATLSQPRCNLSAITSGNKIYFAGGNKDMASFWDFTSPSNRVDIYDNTTASWSVSSMHEPRAWFSGIAINDKIYWAGSGDNIFLGGNLSRGVEIWDSNLQSFSTDCLSQPSMWAANGSCSKR